MIQNFTDTPLSQEEKLAALYQICLRTGAAGQDASSHYCDPKLLGHIYAAPYAIYQPQHCLFWLVEGVIKGYCLAARNSWEFLQTLEAEWWPPLRAYYQNKREQGELSAWSSDELNLLERCIIKPSEQIQQVPSYFEAFPSHLHIDLLPECQGQGIGKRLLQHQLDLLRQYGSCGVHLGVDPKNRAALGFYHKLGFTSCEGDGFLLGVRLSIKDT